MDPDLFLLSLVGLSLICHLPGSRAKNWLLMGGYTGVEGEDGTSSMDNVEILQLKHPQSQYKTGQQWCQARLPPALFKLEGATMEWVSMMDHMENMLATNPTYTSPHSLVIWEKILVCGGADQNYTVSKQCYWWGLEDNTWTEGPKMLYARQRATVLQRNGMIWMLGGREGSTILYHNEVMLYPGVYNGTNHKMWKWMNKDMLKQALWTFDVVEPLKQLPIPLTGHCAVMIHNNLGLIIGGGTNALDKKGEIDYYSEPVPTTHIHFYNFNTNNWISSTDNTSTLNGKSLRRMNVARMNHACIKYRENNKNKVMVVGGVTASVDDEFSVVRTMEILDINSMTWRQGLEVPDSVTGTNLILIDGRPALVGRYGDEQQRKILRYTDRDLWENIPVDLLDGRSDYQIVRDIPQTVNIWPNTNSARTRTNPGQCGSPDFANKLFFVENGKQLVTETNHQQQPWLQLDLGKVFNVVEVFFETGDASVSESFNVRAGNMTVPDTELVNSTITVNNDCGSIDGVTTRVACCGHVARHVTIQVEGSSTVLKIGKILVKVALPRCDTSQPLTSLCKNEGYYSAHNAANYGNSTSTCP